MRGVHGLQPPKRKPVTFFISDIFLRLGTLAATSTPIAYQHSARGTIIEPHVNIRIIHARAGTLPTLVPLVHAGHVLHELTERRAYQKRTLLVLPALKGALTSHTGLDRFSASNQLLD